MRSTILGALSLSLLGLLSLSAQAQPTVLSADPLGNPGGITIVYSEPMDSASAQALGSYTLTNAVGAVVPISSATLAANLTNVFLQLGSQLQMATNYTLVLSGVKNQALATITPNPTLKNFWFGGNPNGLTFDFNDGQVPSGTRLAVGPDGAGNQVNPYQSVTNSGGFTNSGWLILAKPAGGQTFGQWRMTNDYSGGVTVTNLHMTFKLFMGNGTGGSTPPGLPNGGGNGMLLHWGPGLLEQYTGGASSFGYGLDLTFRSYNSSPNVYGVNVYYGGTSGAGNNSPIVNVPYIGYFNTNGALDDFSEACDVSLTISNGLLSLTITPTNGVATNVFNNYAIPGFVPQPMGGNNFGFTTTDGSGAHEAVGLDNVDIWVNGAHIPPGGQVVGPVGFSLEPLSVTTNENVEVTFNCGVTGAPPVFYQWYANNVAIPGATASTYKTPLTLYSTMNGLHYSVAVSNNFSSATSADAILTLIQDTNGTQVASVGSVSGNSVGVLFTAYVDVNSAGNPANYLINGVQPIAATVRTAFANLGNYVLTADPVTTYAPAYLKTVKLTPASPVSGSFTVTVKPGVLSRTGLPVTQTNLTGMVLGMLDTDLHFDTLGTDPAAAGEAFSAGANQLELIAGGGDLLPIAAISTDRGHYAYQTRTGNFDMVAKLTWETATMSAAKAGMMVRSFVGNPADPTDGTEPTIALTLFPATGRNTYETGARFTYGDRGYPWAAPGVAANGNVGASWANGGPWLRIRRLGATFMGYASASASDGSPASWTLIGLTNADIYSFPAQEWVGLVATAANNDGRLTEADFSNWGPMTFATASVTITNNLRSSPNYTNYENSASTFAIGATVNNAPLGELVYQWQRKGKSDSTFADIIDGTGNTNLYLTPRLSVATDDGAQYRCVAYVGDLSTGHSATSAVATLTVLVDTNPPYMTAAAADATFTQLRITFDGPMDYFSLGDPAHYTLVPQAGGAAISITQPPVAIANPDYTYTSVLVTLDSALSPGVKYVLTTANLLDSSGNNINNTTVPGGRQRVVSGWVLAYGFLKYERWMMGDSSSSVTALRSNPNFPNYPDVVQLVSYSGYPNGDISNPTVSITGFGDRLSGFVIPPTNGNYNFYARANDGVVFLMNTNTADITRANMVVKAVADNVSNQSWLYSVTNALTFSGTAIDTNPVVMVAGQPYYIECQHKQGTGTSYTEFTWGNPTNNAMPTLTSAVSTAYGLANGRGGAPTNTYNLSGTNIATWVNPDTSTITATGPTNTPVQQNRTATFSVAATAGISAGGAPSTVPVNYQWMKNGANISGATASSYTTPLAAYPGDNGAVFAVVLSVPSLGFMTITNSAILTVYADTNAPTVVSASSYGQRAIGIRFDALMDAASASNAANYTAVTGGLTVTNAQVQIDGLTVLLQLSGSLAGPTFAVTLNNVKDLAGNAIAANTVATGNVLYPQMAAIDIGVATNASGFVLQTNATLTNVTFNLSYPGSTVMAADGLFEVTASGRDVTGSQDGMHFIYEQRTGDFDVAVRVDGLTVADALSRAGLMFRENLAPGSRSYQIVADPPSKAAADGTGNGQNKVEVIYRSAQNGTTATWPNMSSTAPVGSPNPPSLGSGNSATQIPSIWLRLRLVGNKLYAYTGADAVNWALVARANLAATWPKTTFVGMCASAHTNSYYTSAKLSGYGSYTLPAGKQALLLVGNNANTPAGSPNAPQQSSDAMVYTNLLRLGYNITTLVNESVQAEDAEGKSVVVWSSTGNSGGTGTPSVFTNLPVPLVTWENASPRYLKMVAASVGGNTVGSMTSINITNTTDPVAIALSMGMSGTVTVSASASMLYVNKSDLASGAVIIGQPGGGTTPELRSPFFAFEKGATMNPGTAPQRRVGLFLDDGTPALLTAAGWQLVTNAIEWAAAGAVSDSPTILTQPANVTVPVGSPAMFIVTAVGGSGPYAYQWAKMSGLTPVDIPGATNRDYTILAAGLADTGNYVVKVTALASGLSTTSAAAALQVINTTPASVGFGVAAGALNLSWPADHTGWRLVVQTNTLGSGLNPTGTWYTWPNSTGANSVSIPIDPNAPTVFYRLVYP